MTDFVSTKEAPSGAVENLFQDYEGLVGDLDGASPSGLTALNRSYHKHLLVAAASSLEELVKDLVPSIFGTHGSAQMATFVSKRVMARNYAQLFEWKGQTAQGFFTSFGEACASNFKNALKSDEELKKQHDAFMRLGHLRNEVVHNDYAVFSIDLTPLEIISLYRDAVAFTQRFEALIFEPVID